jgi:hypothetical protein
MGGKKHIFFQNIYKTLNFYQFMITDIGIALLQPQ